MAMNSSLKHAENYLFVYCFETMQSINQIIRICYSKYWWNRSRHTFTAIIFKQSEKSTSTY